MTQEAQYRIEAQTVIELLRSDAYASRQLKELVSTPLFLTLLCIVVFQGGQIPERRAEFFRECLRVLLMPWARRDGEQRLSLDESLDLLQHIAWFMHKAERRDDLGEAELRRVLERPLRGIERHRERKLNVSSVIDWFRRTTGVLTEYATVPAEYGFLHLSLQEYLAARYAATYPAEGIQMLATHYGSSWWREVALLFVALPEYRHFRALMEQVIARGKLVSEREHAYQCLLQAHARELSPFFKLIADRGAPIVQRVEALRLVRGQDDDELIELASEIALEPLPREVDGDAVQTWTELRRLAEQVEAHAPAIVEERFPVEPAVDVLIVCDAADAVTAQALTQMVAAWQRRAEVATSLLIDNEPWLRARTVVVLAGPEYHGPWEKATNRQCLVQMVRRGLSVITAFAGCHAVSRLPPFLQTYTHAEVGVDLYRSQLTAALAELLDLRETGTAVTRATSIANRESTGQSFAEPTTGIRFLWVPGGTFMMGGDALRFASGPPHPVQVSSFWLAEMPVTNRQYEMFLREQQESREPRFWRDRYFNQPEQPVVGITWEDARAFCRWLSELSGQRVELPTEAQWERAARGDDGRMYPWGDEKPDATRAHYGKSWRYGPIAVGSLPAGRGVYGHLDLAGNVWEWCRDAVNGHAYKTQGKLTVDPEGPDANAGDSDVHRAARGGAFDSAPRSLRSAERNWLRAAASSHHFGFRVAASLAEPLTQLLLPAEPQIE